MYERSYGAKYDVKLGTKEIAAKFRADVKAAQKAGELPAGLKLSVRIQRYSGGSSIDVHVVGYEGQLHSVEWLERGDLYLPASKRYVEEFEEVLGKLRDLLAAYNHDGSDSMIDYFDVKFYGHVSVHWEFEREKEALEAAALKVAQAEAVAAKREASLTAEENPIGRAF